MSTESAQLDLSIDAGPGGDDDELERLAQSLRAELLELDVDAVVPATGGAAPDGTRALEALAIGALIVRLAQTSEALSSLVRTVRGWLGPQGERRVRIELDGDVLELSGATDEERDRLIETWVARHARG